MSTETKDTWNKGSRKTIEITDDLDSRYEDIKKKLMACWHDKKEHMEKDPDTTMVKGQPRITDMAK